MRKFDLIYGDLGDREEEGPYLAAEAIEFFWHGNDVFELQQLKVGGSFVDADGDKWVRIE